MKRFFSTFKVPIYLHTYSILPITLGRPYTDGDRQLLDLHMYLIHVSYFKVFRNHGEFCASQPWEVIVATLTFLVCILTVWGRQDPTDTDTPSNNSTQAQINEVRTHNIFYTLNNLGKA